MTITVPKINNCKLTAPEPYRLSYSEPYDRYADIPNEVYVDGERVFYPWQRN